MAESVEVKIEQRPVAPVAYLRLAGVFAWILPLFALRMVAKPVALVSPGTDRRIRRAFFRAAGRGVLRITGLRVEAQGPRPVPPYLLVSNHLTFIDVFVLARELGAVFVSQAEVARWPLFGYITRQMNTVFIDRARRRDTHRVNLLLHDLLQQGEGVVIFPESGVSQTGELQPFKTGLLEPAVQLGVPVHFCAIRYTPPPGAPPVIWLHGVNFFRHYLEVASHGRTRVRVAFGEKALTAENRRVLAAELEDSVRELLVKS